MRRDESPDAETTSKSPVPIFSNMLSDVSATCTFAWQPVADSKGVTQSTDGSVEPSSAYPAHARMLTSPSPSPNEPSASIAGGVARSPPEPPSPEEPQAARARLAAAPTATIASRRVFLIVVSFVLHGSRQGGRCRGGRHLELVLLRPDEQHAATAQL